MQRLRTEISKNKVTYIIVFALLAAATFFRVFRTDQVLGFYFDQGRDANVVADLIDYKKFFLIGPTTGIAGIFRGPFYYYLITPFYFLGGGDPAVPAVFLALTTVLALALLYYLAKLATDRTGGILALILGGFSFYIIYASRWLSNPTPMLLLSMSLIWMMYLITQGKQWAWVVLAFIAGSSLFHFGSSGEFFYFPALFIFSLWQTKLLTKKRNLPPLRIIIASVIAFAVTAAPLVIFDLKHERILSNNLATFFGEKESFKASFWQVLNTRVSFYVDVFYTKIFHSRERLYVVMMLLTLAAGLLRLPKLLKNDVVKISFLMFVSPLVGLLFFQGNEGNVYDYYLTGYYLIFVLLVATSLRQLWRFLPGKILVVIFLALFLKQNMPVSWSWVRDGVDGPTTIAFGNQKQAIEWVYQNADGQEFNTDFYVPPVIPHAYLYLFRWYEKTHDGNVESLVPLLYTIYEQDPPHPERLEAWMKRQEGIGKVIEETKFGGITVQKRIRLSGEEEKKSK